MSLLLYPFFLSRSLRSLMWCLETSSVEQRKSILDISLEMTFSLVCVGSAEFLCRKTGFLAAFL